MIPLGTSELATLLVALESGSFHTMSDDELFSTIYRIHKGFTAVAVTMSAGTKVYRAVSSDPGKRPMTIARLSYPPSDKAPLGRMNAPGESVFYGAFRSYAVCLHEMRSKPGDVFAISTWELCASTSFNQFGYTTTGTNVRGFQRDPPHGVMPPDEGDRNRLIREWQTRVFRKEVLPDDNAFYRLTIAMMRLGISELPRPLQDGSRNFPGIMYPSVGTFLMGDNVAIPAANVARLLRFQGVELIQVRERVSVETETGTKPGFHREVLASGHARPDGSLIWE